MKTVGERT